MDPREAGRRRLAAATMVRSVLVMTAILAGCDGIGATPAAVPAASGTPRLATPTGTPNATTSPRSTVEPTPTPTPTTATVPALAWTRVPIPPMFDGGTSWPTAVAAGDDVFSAVGGRVFADTDTPSGGTAGAWRSGDGLAWTPATAKGLAVGDGIPMDDYPQPGLIDVGWGPSGFVGLGVVLGPEGRAGATWSSADGRTWQRTRLPDSSLARPAAVTWDGANYVMVGVVNEPDAPRAAAWRSTDGASWRRVPDQDAFAIGGYITYPAAIGSGGPVDVAAAADGSVVAVGSTCTGTASMEERSVCRPFAIESDDGEDWTALPVPADPGVVLLSVAATDSRVVAIARGPGRDEQQARVVIADEGRSRVVEPRGVPDLSRVLPYGDGLLALSRAADVVSLWWSPDGEAWSAIPDVPQPPGVESIASEVDLAARGAVVVVIATAETSDVDDAGGFALVGSR